VTSRGFYEVEDFSVFGKYHEYSVQIMPTNTILPSLLLSSMLLIFGASQAFAQSFVTKDINVISQGVHVDTLGNIMIIGELQNISEEPMEFIQIKATFYDDAKRVVGTGTGYSMIDVLRPNENSTFEIQLLDEGQSAKAKSYKLFAFGDKRSMAKPGTLELTVGEGYVESLTGMFHLVGEVTNKGRGFANFVEVSAGFYDEERKIVATGMTYTEPVELAPGESAPFDIIVPDADASRDIKYASVNAESEKYASMNMSQFVELDPDTRQPEELDFFSSEDEIDLFEDDSSQEFFIDNSNTDREEGESGSAQESSRDSAAGEQESDCDPSYPDVCIPSAPPDLDCGDVSYDDFRVRSPDPHRFDNDGDGRGCES
jgi:hypothetical protein